MSLDRFDTPAKSTASMPPHSLRHSGLGDRLLHQFAVKTPAADLRNLVEGDPVAHDAPSLWFPEIVEASLCRVSGEGGALVVDR
jgi:hypothetical protein